MAGKGNPKTGGRQPGTPNQITRVLKTAIIDAAEQAGGDDGLVGYLATQAKENPICFMALLTKILPIQEEEERLRRTNEPMTLDLNFFSGPNDFDTTSSK